MRANTERDHSTTRLAIIGLLTAATLPTAATISVPATAHAEAMTRARLNPGVDNPNLTLDAAGNLLALHCAATCATDAGMYPSFGTYPMLRIAFTDPADAPAPVEGGPWPIYGAGSWDQVVHGREWNGGAGAAAQTLPADRLGLSTTWNDGICGGDPYVRVPYPYEGRGIGAPWGRTSNPTCDGTEAGAVDLGPEFTGPAINWVLQQYLGDGDPATIPPTATLALQQSLGWDPTGSDNAVWNQAVVYAYHLLSPAEVHANGVNQRHTLPFGVSPSQFVGAGANGQNAIPATPAEIARIVQLGEAMAHQAMLEARWGPYQSITRWEGGVAPTTVGRTGHLLVYVGGCGPDSPDGSDVPCAPRWGGGGAAAPIPDGGVYGTGRPGATWNLDNGIGLVQVPTPTSTRGATVVPELSPTCPTVPAGFTCDDGWARFSVTVNSAGADTLTTTATLPDWEPEMWAAVVGQDIGIASALSRPVSATIGFDVRSAPGVTTQVTTPSPTPGAPWCDTVTVTSLADGVTADVQLQAFDLTDDPSGAGAPLVDVTLRSLTNGTTGSVGCFTVPLTTALHQLGFRERVLSTSDGTVAQPGVWSTLGTASETGTAAALHAAEVHLRKTVSNDQHTWVNAQRPGDPAYAPTTADADPAATSHDDGTADPGDDRPVYRDGDRVSFQYEVWLDPSSTGAVSWPHGTMGVVTDDGGTAADTADDTQPAYVDGDDGDGMLELHESWRYRAVDVRIARAGETYTNVASIPSGEIHNPGNPAGPAEGASSPRQDRAGYQVPALTTTLRNPADATRLIGPEGGRLVDSVCYRNVVPGAEVAISGELQVRQADGSMAATGMTGSTTFTPAETNGCVDVTFSVPASAAGTTFVAFESLTPTATGAAVAWHRDPDDGDQTVRQRRLITVTTRTCATSVIAARGATTAATCDRVTVHGDPFDVVTGTSTAYPWAGALRGCATPGPSVAWQVTLGADGVGTVVTPLVAMPIGAWEWIEAASTADGRTAGRRCATSPKEVAESFTIVRSGERPTDVIPSMGGNTVTMIRRGAELLAVGAALSAMAWWPVRRRGHRQQC